MGDIECGYCVLWGMAADRQGDALHRLSLGDTAAVQVADRMQTLKQYIVRRAARAGVDVSLWLGTE